MTNSGSHTNVADRISQLCSRYEAACVAGKKPRIETLLDAVNEKYRSQLLKALLQVEIEYRARNGVAVKRDEFLERFAQYANVVKAVLPEPGTTDPLAAEETYFAKPEAVPVLSGSQPQQSSPADGQLPSAIGRYRIKSLLGAGAMGSVYLAVDPTLNRQVAIKCPHPSLKNDKVLLERFRREAQTAASIQHPNICPIHEIGEADGLPFFCMRYVEGRSLQSFAGPGGGLNERQITSVVLKISRAIEAAHARDVVHRDLKPSNIIVNSAGEPIIMDFGIAQRMDEADSRLTATGQSIGSPAYMSPEQVEGDPTRIGAQTDVYSLGVIMYELLTGKPPFSGSLGTIMSSILKEEPAPPSSVRPELNVRLENICMKMMQKEKTKRYPSMSAVSEALSAHLKRTSPKKKQPTQPTETAAQVPALTRARQTKALIQNLIKAGQYPSAIRELERLASEPGESVRHIALWASAELPKIREQRDVIREGRGDIYETATALVKKHDYDAAIEVLESYPPDLRTSEMTELLHLAIDRAEEASLLLDDINAARRDKQLDGILPNVNRYLELKPGNRRIVALKKELIGTGFRAPSEYIFKSRPKQLRKIPVWGEWVGLGAIGVYLLGFVLIPYFQGGGSGGSEVAEQGEVVAGVGADQPAAVAGTTPEPITNAAINSGATHGLDFARIGPGGFYMGCRRPPDQLKELHGEEHDYSDEFPRHSVRISDKFEILKTEVTQFSWESVMGSSPWTSQGVESAPQHPATCISYDDAVQFCEKLTEEQGDAIYRLPTEAEWEYACRASTTSDFGCGNDIEKLKLFAIFGQADTGPRRVAIGQANKFGLFDMHGNVAEWCSDRYAADYYEGSPSKDPTGPESGDRIVARGGHWQASANLCRSSCRSSFPAETRTNLVGFRVVRIKLPVPEESPTDEASSDESAD